MVDDLSDDPYVSGNLVASIPSKVSNARSPGDLGWLGNP